MAQDSYGLGQDSEDHKKDCKETISSYGFEFALLSEMSSVKISYVLVRRH